ncbi:MAG: FAD-binding oxidoreductase [Armatimonadetes bacterium]|nr:FAD-binding oxidoreductase [Armatimonadota bacterium]
MPAIEAPPWSLPQEEATFPRLSGRESCQIAVVGAGVAGLSAALHLALAGIAVGLVEAGRVGAGDSAHGNGMALPGMPEHYGAMVEAVGRDAARGWWRLARDGIEALTDVLRDHRLECDWTRGGALLLASSEVELGEMTRAAREETEDGFEARLMGPAAASNYVPVADCEGALYLPPAICLDPVQAMVQMARLAAELGAAVREDSPALEVVLKNERAVVRCAQGELDAEVVVIAAGHGSSTLLPVKVLFPLRGQNLATEAVREGPRGSTPAVSGNRGHEMYRRLSGEGMIASGINPGSGPAEKTAERRVDPAFQDFLQALAYRRFPEMARVEVERRWATVYTCTVDGLPLIGPLPGHHRMHALAGFSSRSWSLGFGAGRAVARLLAGQTGELPPGSSPRRFL